MAVLDPDFEERVRARVEEELVERLSRASLMSILYKQHQKQAQPPPPQPQARPPRHSHPPEPTR
jgi:hypothetical protein